jgi:hypothetical protein
MATDRASFSFGWLIYKSLPCMIESVCVNISDILIQHWVKMAFSTNGLTSRSAGGVTSWASKRGTRQAELRRSETAALDA